MRIDHGLLPGHVLQRLPKGARATITGTCDGSGPITATVRKGAKALPGFKAAKVGTAEEGRFRAVITGLPTGGPYTVELTCDGVTVSVPDVFVGDLWLMAGQSNMEGVGRLADAPAPHPLVRNFSMARTWELARDPLHVLGESPDRVHTGATLTGKAAAQARRRAVKGTGVGVYFGRLMQERSGVPQGLIATAHGGTSMQQWDPALKDQAGASLYGSMWLSLQAVGQPIAGVLWYQGCSDTSPAAAAVYTGKMQALVAAVRRDLGQPKLPWVIVQIGRVTQGVLRDPRPWNDIQEHQRLLPTTIPRCDVVPAVDLELDDLIHISGKAFSILAQRMARVAARLVLGDRSEQPAPQPRSVRLIDGKPGQAPQVEVRFANLIDGLHADGLPWGFTVVDRLHRPVDAVFKTELAGDRAILHLMEAPQQGCWLQYGHGVNPICNLRDGRGMAIPVFGPWKFATALPVSGWAVRWQVGAVTPREDIAALDRPKPGDPAAKDRSFTGEFVNLHDEWQTRSGHVAFHGHLDCAEAMDLEARFGYDGPVRLWLGDDEIHRDLKGTNPALKDAHRIGCRVAAGRHPLTVLMALNGGRAWGFFLRFARTGVEPADGLAVPVPWA